MLNRTLAAQAQHAYDAALNSPCPDWRAVTELFRAAMRTGPVRRAGKPTEGELADYNVDRVRLMCRSPRIAVRFMDGEAVFTHVPSAPGKPLNIGRALRVAIVMYRSRKSVQRRAGFHEYERAMPVPEIFQVRCLETDELFDVSACNRHTAEHRQGSVLEIRGSDVWQLRKSVIVVETLELIRLPDARARPAHCALGCHA